MHLSPLHYSVTAWLAVVAGAVAIGLGKGGLNGLGILPVLLFALVFQPRESTGFVLPLLIVGDLCAVGVYWKVVHWRAFRTLLPPALLGVAVGSLVMGHLSNQVFGPLVGWIILALIGLHFLRSALGGKLEDLFLSPGFGVAMGVLAGFTTMLSNSAGPVANLYFLSVGLAKWNIIGTAAWFFFALNVCKLPFSANLGLTNAASLELALLLAPLVVLGVWGGRLAAKAMPQAWFERFLLICTALGALRLIG